MSAILSLISLPPDELTVGPLYSKIAACKSKYIILQGGKWSSKTVNTLVHLGILATQSKLVITVVGSTVPNLKKGALRDFKTHVACKKGIREYIASFNQSDRVYTFRNGSVIEFVSYSTALEATSGKRDYIFFNEVNGIAYDIFYNASISTKYQVIMDYNPTAPFFVHAKFINAKEGDQYFGKWTRYITDHRHNPFLDAEKHAEIESISDPERFRVYARGMTGKVEGVIYRFEKATVVPDGMKFGFGIDFGYNSDQSAIVKVWYSETSRDRYYQLLLYKTENEILTEIVEKKMDTTVYKYMADILLRAGCTTSTLVWGDHDISYSNAFRKLRIPFRMARKGPNTLAMGISKVKECNNYYLPSAEMDVELETYLWDKAVDMLTGEEVMTGTPVEGTPDHALAAIRYFNFSYAMRFTQKKQDEEDAA